jgi:hypothetical protein
MNDTPDTAARLWIAAILLLVIAAWCGFPWAAFAQPFPVQP